MRKRAVWQREILFTVQLSLVCMIVVALLGRILPKNNDELHNATNYLDNAGDSRVKQNTRIPRGGIRCELGCVRLLIDNVENDACKPYCRADNLNDADDFFWFPHNVLHPPWISIFLLCNAYFEWIGNAEIGILCS